MFVGRRDELEKLNKAFAEPGYQCCMLYGRRRIGKTRLITEFLKDKKHIFLVGTRDTETELLKIFSEAVLRQYPTDGMPFIESFSSWENLFSYIAAIANKERIVLAIDEFPYIAEAVPSIQSKIQKYCDHEWKDAGLFIILCGSSMSFMERQITDYESPLYGRRTMQIKLSPLPYYESIEFMNRWSDIERLYAYSICGGIPQYLERFSLYDNLQEAVENELLSASGGLYEEPMVLMNEELREPAVYSSIIRAIANGKTKLNEIASAIGKESSRISIYISNLISLGIIDKKYPIGSKNSKKVIYVVKDNLFRFYFRFISSNKWLIENGQSRIVYSTIKSQMSDYFGFVFEDICKQYLMALDFNGKLPVLFTEIGSWWGTNPIEKKEEEIDIVMTSDDDILIAECKWQNEVVGDKILKTLMKRGALIQNGRRIHYAIFSKSGFTDTLEKDPSTLLFKLEDIMHLDR